MTDEDVETVHTWFGPEGAPLFGALHLPAGGRARAVAVILPPIGLEMLVSRRGLRVLADRLARRGIAALRVDYLGTGNSAGVAFDDDQVPGWLSTVGEGVEYARRAGAPRVAVVGLRLGAVIAARAATGVDAVVLWDPVETGARFLREEALFYRAGVKDSGEAPPDPDGVVGPGTWYSGPTAAALRSLSVAAVLDGERGAARARDGIGPVLLATRSEAEGGHLTATLSAATGVDTVAVPGQEAYLDWGDMTVPEAALDEIVSWLEPRLGDTYAVLDPDVRPRVVAGVAPDGSLVEERIVRFGDHGQFGILTEVAGRERETLVLANAAPPAFHVGPAGMWVEIAREHAWRSGPVLRFDGRTDGESRGGGAVTYPASYTVEAVEDVVAAIEAARDLGAGATTVAGLCSGSWTALRAAQLTRADTVVAINPAFWRIEPLTAAEGAWPQVNVAPGGGPGPAPRLLRALRNAVRRAVRELIPEALWWRMSRRGLLHAPSGIVTLLVRAGTHVHLVLGVDEGPWFDHLRGARLERSLRSDGRLQVTRVPQVDHALLSLPARRAMFEALVDSLETREGGDVRHERVGRPDERLASVTTAPTGGSVRRPGRAVS